MVSDLWGDDPPLIAEDDLPALPERLQRLASLSGPTPMSELGEDPETWRAPSGKPSAADLTEVQMLADRGWAVTPREPWLRFLPAVWPAQYRGWIRNRVPWVWRCAGQPPTLAPPTETDLMSEAEAQEEYPSDLEGTGIPVPPLGRIWLLRSPFDSVTVSEIAQAVQGVAVRRAGGEDIFLNKRHLVDAARDVLSWDSATIKGWREATRRA